MTIFLAGHETIANALTWTIHLITEHPQEESEIIDEITTLDDKVKDKNSFKVISFEDANRLKYVEKVMMESMRLNPPS